MLDVKFLFGLYPYDEIHFSSRKYSNKFGEIRRNAILLLRGRIIGFGYKICDIPGIGNKFVVSKNVVEFGIQSVKNYLKKFIEEERDEEFKWRVSRMKYFEGKLSRPPYRPIFETVGRDNDGSRYKICENPWYGIRSGECQYSIRKENKVATLTASGVIKETIEVEWEKKFRNKKALQKKLFELTNKNFSLW